MNAIRDKQRSLYADFIALQPCERAQKLISNVISYNSHCEECVVKMAICLMASCGGAAFVGRDKHGNKSNGGRFAAGDPSDNVGLLAGSKFISMRMFGS